MRPFHALASCARFMHPFHAPVSCACFMRPFHAHPFHAPLPCPVSCTRFMHPFYARPQSPITIHNQRTPVHIFPPLSIPVLSGAHTSIPIHTLPYPSIFFQAFPSSSTTVLTILLRAYLSIPGGGVATVWRRCGYGVACYRPCLAGPIPASPASGRPSDLKPPPAQAFALVITTVLLVFRGTCNVA